MEVDYCSVLVCFIDYDGGEECFLKKELHDRRERLREQTLWRKERNGVGLNE